MTSIAVAGAHGWVGSALCSALASNPDHVVTGVTRDNSAQMRQRPYDVLINAAMPSKRFWAKNNPAQDFAETVEKTADLVYGWKFGKFIQISTVSARCQLHTVYGRHKAAAEDLCSYGKNLILRLGPMYGRGLKKGVLIDMLEGRKVFIDGESRYCFTSVEFVCRWIASHLHLSGTVEVGARDAVRLRDVADHLGLRTAFEGDLDHQEIQNPAPDFPEARGVFAFLDALPER